jgi:aminobenzoyl-glutamate utilization protein B
MKKYSCLIVCCVFLFNAAFAQKNNLDTAKMKKDAIANLQSKYETYKTIAHDIWGFAEVGFKETKSSALLQNTLRENGFEVKANIAGMPTAFIASYGSGKPVIAILAEYDALPGLSQKAIPEKSGFEGGTAGHGCGHHLFGTASVAAGIEIKKLIEQKNFKGTIRVYGCPAEEGGSGKVYMVRDGLFNDVDAAIHTHPDNKNIVMKMEFLANSSAKFRFHGISSHAAGSPEKGRSALDGVEALNNMVNMMREHVPQETRIHYVITNGGKAPNVVPDFAEVYYYVRHPKKVDVQQIFERVVKAAEGAALGTGTTMDYEIVGGTHDMLLNNTLDEAMQANLLKTGGVTYSKDELEFGKKLQATFGFKAPGVEEAATIQPLKFESGGGSTDVGDVSYTVPTVGVATATWIPGTPAHSWQAVACGGTEIGTKGMMVAAKAMSLTAIDLFTNPSLLQKAKDEFVKAKGDYKYKPLLGNRKPMLNYRD